MEKKVEWSFFKETNDGLEVVGNYLTWGLVAALIEVALFLIAHCFGYRITDPAFVAMLLGAGILILTGQLIPEKKYLDGGLKCLGELCLNYMKQGYTPFHGFFCDSLETVSVNKGEGDFLPQLLLNRRLSSQSLSRAILYFQKEENEWTYVLKIGAELDFSFANGAGLAITNVLYGRWNGTEELRQLLRVRTSSQEAWRSWLFDIGCLMRGISRGDVEDQFERELTFLYPPAVDENIISYSIIPNLPHTPDFETSVEEFFKRLMLLKECCGEASWELETAPKFPALLYTELVGAIPEKYAGNFGLATVVEAFWCFYKALPDVDKFVDSAGLSVSTPSPSCLQKAEAEFSSVLDEFIMGQGS